MKQAKLLKTLRKRYLYKTGKSTTQLAADMGCSVCTLNRYERGCVPTPSPAVVRNIALAYGLDETVVRLLAGGRRVPLEMLRDAETAIPPPGDEPDEAAEPETEAC